MFDVDQLNFYKDYEQLITITGLIISVMKASINSIMVILFLHLFSFFLTYRENHIRSKTTPNLTLLNKFIIVWVYFLTALSVWNIGSLLVDGVAKFNYGVSYS